MARDDGVKEDIRAADPGTQGEVKEAQDSFPMEEPADARLERLGRQRPAIFNSAWSEMGFVFSISMSQVLSASFMVKDLAFAANYSRNTLFLALLSFYPL